MIRAGILIVGGLLIAVSSFRALPPPRLSDFAPVGMILGVFAVLIGILALYGVRL